MNMTWNSCVKVLVNADTNKYTSSAYVIRSRNIWSESRWVLNDPFLVCVFSVITKMEQQYLVTSVPIHICCFVLSHTIQTIVLLWGNELTMLTATIEASISLFRSTNAGFWLRILTSAVNRLVSFPAHMCCVVLPDSRKESCHPAVTITRSGLLGARTPWCWKKKKKPQVNKTVPKSNEAGFSEMF